MSVPKIFGIAGWKNSGKTSLVAALVSEFAAVGLEVSTIKHAHHAFDLDTEGTDSHQHRAAGAKEVVLVSSNRWAIQHELRGASEPSLKDMLGKISPCDLVLVEGYKRENIPKIEIVGSEPTGDYLWPKDKNIVAIACDYPLEGCALPSFHRKSIFEIAKFILDHHGMSA